MTAAMTDAGVQSSDIWSVNAHATSTPLGDKAEAGAIASVLSGWPAHVTSNKGSIGHLLGAAGAVESVFSVMSVYEGIVPPTINIQNIDPEIVKLNLKIVKNSYVCDFNSSRRVLLKNSFGFGGTNACLIFESYS